jgi:hypothetical protein
MNCKILLFVILFFINVASCGTQKEHGTYIREQLLYMSDEDCTKISQAVTESYTRLNPNQINSSSFHFEIMPVDMFPFFALSKPVDFKNFQKVYCKCDYSYYIYKDESSTYAIVAGKSYFSSPKIEPKIITYRLFFYTVSVSKPFEYLKPVSINFILVNPGQYAPQ